MKSKTVFVREDELVGVNIPDLNIYSPLCLRNTTKNKKRAVIVNNITPEGVYVEAVDGKYIKKQKYYLSPLPILGFLQDVTNSISKDDKGVYIFNNAPSLSLRFNDEGDVVLKDNTNTIVIPPYVHSLVSTLSLLYDTKEDFSLGRLFEEDIPDEKEVRTAEEYFSNLEIRLSRFLLSQIESLSREYEAGFTKKEVSKIKEVLEVLGTNIEVFDNTLQEATPTTIEDNIVYPIKDVLKAVLCVLEGNGLKIEGRD